MRGRGSEEGREVVMQASLDPEHPHPISLALLPGDRGILHLRQTWSLWRQRA